MLYKKDEQQKGEQQNSALRGFAIFSQIGFTIAACVIGGVLLGKFLDNLLCTSPWLLLVFALLGTAAAIWVIFRLAKIGGK